jgi:spore coat polysaccharide biosynthesis protein SpsF (cytidylyltransferase family)
MAEVTAPTRVQIIIQARSGSTRFPQKCVADLAGKPILKWVIDSAKSAAQYFNQYSSKSNVQAAVALAIPEGDEVVKAFSACVPVVEGPAHDVLKRYKLAADRFDADYICRLTGDCPLLPDFMVQKSIDIAVTKKYDYFSNVDERVRTVPDGWDVEVFSRRLLDFTDENATEPGDREHVTTFMRRCPPYWATTATQQSRYGASLPLLLCGIKLSVDTPEDLARIRPIAEELLKRGAKAETIFGRYSVHRF